MEKVTIGNAELYCGDCTVILPQIEPVFFVTDPPYPNEYAEEYGYKPGLLKALNITEGYVFWTAREPFELTSTSVHVWDKKINVGRDYELIYEINGSKRFSVFRHYLINSTVAASMTGDVFNEHPSQKPVALMMDLLLKTKTEKPICDPFMGSGTTGVAAVNLEKRFIGIERERKYFDIACERIDAAQAQGRLAI